jgi:hypothetical protein
VADFKVLDHPAILLGGGCEGQNRLRLFMILFSEMKL